MIETKQQKEQRRKTMGFNNPIHDWWAKRNAKGKWIGGVFIRPELLMKARAMMIEKMEKETIKRSQWWYRIYFWLLKLWRKLF